MARFSIHDSDSLVDVSLTLKHFLPGKYRQKEYDHKNGDEEEEEESGDVRGPCGDARESEQRGDDCYDQKYCSPL